MELTSMKVKYYPICKAEGEHRFVLEQEGENVLIVIGLNPSTADEKNADPTMQSVLRFVNRWGYDGFVMINLSSERCTIPQNMAKLLDFRKHKKNICFISKIAQKYPDADVLVAFGDNIVIREYLPLCFFDIHKVLSSDDRRWLHIGGPKGMTAKGHPRHPLYAKVEDGLVEFDAMAYTFTLMANLSRRFKRIKPDYKGVTEAIYDYLAGKKDGYEVSTRELVNKVFGPGQCEYYGPYLGCVTFFSLFTITGQDYSEIDKQLMTLVKQRKAFRLDFSKYEGQFVGLPYNIPFVLRRKNRE